MASCIPWCISYRTVAVFTGWIAPSWCSQKDVGGGRSLIRMYTVCPNLSLPVMLTAVDSQILDPFIPWSLQTEAILPRPILISVFAEKILQRDMSPLYLPQTEFPEGRHNTGFSFRPLVDPLFPLFILVRVKSMGRFSDLMQFAPLVVFARGAQVHLFHFFSELAHFFKCSSCSIKRPSHPLKSVPLSSSPLMLEGP